jgi:hypothetical protein
MVRLPHDVKQFLALQSRRNGASQNSEIIRSVRERMDREYIREPLGPQK